MERRLLQLVDSLIVAEGIGVVMEMEEKIIILRAPQRNIIGLPILIGIK